jgi:hypothetical protein
MGNTLLKILHCEFLSYKSKLGRTSKKDLYNVFAYFFDVKNRGNILDGLD